MVCGKLFPGRVNRIKKEQNHRSACSVWGNKNSGWNIEYRLKNIKRWSLGGREKLKHESPFASINSLASSFQIVLPLKQEFNLCKLIWLTLFFLYCAIKIYLKINLFIFFQDKTSRESWNFTYSVCCLVIYHPIYWSCGCRIIFNFLCERTELYINSIDKTVAMQTKGKFDVNIECVLLVGF